MHYYLTLILFAISSLCVAQEAVSLNINISTDTVYMDNAFRIQYSVKNGSSNGFLNPELNDFQLLQGPSRSSQMSFINGARSSEESYTYYFKPNKIGTFKIEAFTLEIDGKTYKSNSPKVIVIPNPEGLHQDPNSGQVEGLFLPLKKKKAKRKRYRI